MKKNNTIIVLVFFALQLVVAFGFQQPVIIQSNIAEMRSNPSNYQGELVRIVGWLKTNYYVEYPMIGVKRFFAGFIENNEGYIGIAPPDKIATDIFILKDGLFEKFWNIRKNYDIHNPCKKDIEVEVEGFIKENKEFLEEWSFNREIQGVLLITRVIRIEEKYRTPPVGFCADKLRTPEEVLEELFSVPTPSLDHSQPELNLEIVPLNVNPTPPRRH